MGGARGTQSVDANPELWKRRENGTVELIEIPRSFWAPDPGEPFIARQVLYRWLPPYQLAGCLPDWYDFSLLCLFGRDGQRRFVPVDSELATSEYGSKGLARASGIPGLTLVASLGGHAILGDRGELLTDLPLTYHESRLFAQYVRHMREHLGSTAKLGRALGLCAGGSAARGSVDILPDDLGLDTRGHGQRWDLIRLREEGIAGATAAGHPNPTPDQILRFGLLAAATITPFRFGLDEIKDLVRLTLFDFASTTEWAESADLEHVDGNTREEKLRHFRAEAIAYVAHHTRESLKGHLHDTTEEFDRWLKDPKSDLVRRISKRKDCNLSRRQVRRALLEIGWQSLETVGRCIDAQMRAFQAALPEPLTEAETLLFASSYLSNPDFGGLPLLLLHDRLDFLREAILETWNRPDDRDAVAVLHTMMHYYSELASNRRAADRRYKQRAGGRTVSGYVPRDKRLRGDEHRELNRTDDDSRPREGRSLRSTTVPSDDGHGSSNDSLRSVAAHLREQLGIECDRGCTHWDYDTRANENGTVETTFACECGRTERATQMPLTKYTKIARQVLGDAPN